MASDPLEDTADATASALFRHAALCLLWFARFVFRTPPEVPPQPAAIAIDAVLLFAYVTWANKPLQRALGERFGKRPHWSGIFVIPAMLSLFFFLRDAYLIAREFFL